MENPKAAAVARLKEANNVLVTVSTNPSVDQLAGAIGLTLLLNKLGKHATAVFSGEIPSTIEFLQPEETLESNTDSLRDFIIALDKSKADKLRYKVEEKQVRIFITPYRTSLSEDDLEFSHGDFNVDVVVALGVHEQQDLDQAIVGHGRILHDATIITVNTQPNGSLGTISWVNEQASSLCEMLADIGVELKADVLDAQMATALLTGIVAETERFSNQRTSSNTMNISAKLMAAGANQQLVATKLQSYQGEVEVNPSPDNNAADGQPGPDAYVLDNDDGSLKISHDETNADDSSAQQSLEEKQSQDGSENPSAGNNDGGQNESESQPDASPDDAQENSGSRIITEPPSLGGALTASGLPEDTDQSSDPLTLPPVDAPILSHTSPLLESSSPITDEVHEPTTIQPEENTETDTGNNQQPLITPSDDESQTQNEDNKNAPPETGELKEDGSGSTIGEEGKTLAELEQAVDGTPAESTDTSPQPGGNDEVAEVSQESHIDAARAAVSQAVSGSTEDSDEPLQAQGAQPVNLDLGHHDQESASGGGDDSGHEYLDVSTIDENTGLPKDNNQTELNSAGTGSNTLPPPPPMPPPMMPPSMVFGEQPLPNSENDNQGQDPLAPL